VRSCVRHSCFARQSGTPRALWLFPHGETRRRESAVPAFPHPIPPPFQPLALRAARCAPLPGVQLRHESRTTGPAARNAAKLQSSMRALPVSTTKSNPDRRRLAPALAELRYTTGTRTEDRSTLESEPSADPEAGIGWGVRGSPAIHFIPKRKANPGANALNSGVWGGDPEARAFAIGRRRTSSALFAHRLLQTVSSDKSSIRPRGARASSPRASQSRPQPHKGYNERRACPCVDEDTASGAGSR